MEAVTAITEYPVSRSDTIRVNGMSIATNAGIVRQELVDSVKTMLYLHIERDSGTGTMVSAGDIQFYGPMPEELNDRFCVAVSMDRYHEPIA